MKVKKEEIYQKLDQAISVKLPEAILSSKKMGRQIKKTLQKLSGTIAKVQTKLEKRGRKHAKKTAAKELKITMGAVQDPSL